jgi:hypothetical protein
MIPGRGVMQQIGYHYNCRVDKFTGEEGDRLKWNAAAGKFQ